MAQPAELPVRIRALTASEQGAATALLAAGMRDNPLHVRIFGADKAARERRLRRFMAPLLSHVGQNGTILGASQEGELVGVIGLIRPGSCRPGLAERLRIGAELASGHDPLTLARIWRWLRIWERSEPASPHRHLGPLAVAASHRRQGIGSRLVEAACEIMDREPAPSWLETDLEVNVVFYRRFGFETVRQKPVLGVPNWFMGRPKMAVRGEEG